MSSGAIVARVHRIVVFLGIPRSNSLDADGVPCVTTYIAPGRLTDATGRFRPRAG